MKEINTADFCTKSSVRRLASEEGEGGIRFEFGKQFRRRCCFFFSGLQQKKKFPGICRALKIMGREIPPFPLSLQTERGKSSQKCS